MTEDAKLERILEAAYTCFTRHGVRRTTMDDIANAAGISRPAVYQHVRSKDDAFRRLGTRLLDASLTQARTAASTPAPVTDRLLGALQAKLDMTLRLWHESPAHAAELLGADTRLMADLIDAYNTAMLDLLATTIADARPLADSQEFAHLLLALTRGLEADPTDPDTARSRLRQGVTLLVAGLDHPLPQPQESS